jgi:hypothetical protein
LKRGTKRKDSTALASFLRFAFDYKKIEESCPWALFSDRGLVREYSAFLVKEKKQSKLIDYCVSFSN